LIEKTIEVAKNYFKGDYICSQSVLRAILEAKGLYFETASMLAAGFGGGISRHGEICGSVTGVIMAIGILHSLDVKDPIEHRKRTYKSVNDFIDKFTKIHGSTTCNKLVGFDIKNSSLREKANNEGLFDNLCPSFIETAIRIIFEMFP